MTDELAFMSVCVTWYQVCILSVRTVYAQTLRRKHPAHRRLGVPILRSSYWPRVSDCPMGRIARRTHSTTSEFSLQNPLSPQLLAKKTGFDHVLKPGCLYSQAAEGRLARHKPLLE